MVTIQIFTEGGGERGQPSKNLGIEMRRSFTLFISKAGFDQRDFKVERCGSRDQAFKCFNNAMNRRDPKKMPWLLVDSEGPIPDHTNPWDFLQNRDGWKRPEGAGDEQVHLMVQCMETWFLADLDALARYFGQGFHANSLPKTQPIEAASKDAILGGLDEAAKNTAKKKYDKGSHSFAVLECLDPLKVQGKSPWVCRLFNTLAKELGYEWQDGQEPVYRRIS